MILLPLYSGTVLAQSCFWAWQDLAGQTLTRPFHARPRKCHLVGVNDYHSIGQVTCSQHEPRSLHLSVSHFPCPLFISQQVNYSSCSNTEPQICSTNTLTAHSKSTDIIAHNEKINAPVWTAEIKSLCAPQICSNGCYRYGPIGAGTGVIDFKPDRN